MKFILSVLLIICSLSLSSQILSTGLEKKITFPDRFEPKKMEALEDGSLLAIGQQRNGPDLQALIVKIERETGRIISEKSFGSLSAADRCFDLMLEAPNSNWILVNSFEGQNTIQLYNVDDNLNVAEHIRIDIDKIAFGQAIGKISVEKIWILASYNELIGKSYPVLIIHDRLTNTNDIFGLDKKNPDVFAEKYKAPTRYTDEFGQLIDVDVKPVKEKRVAIYKQGNDLFDINGQMIIVGMENTFNYGDFWAASLTTEGETNWEHLYEKENDPGVDALQVAIDLGNGNTALIGMHYNKRDDLNYSYHTLIVNNEGNIISSIFYDTGFDEYLVSAQEIDNQILLSGYLNQEPVKDWVGENVVTSNLYFILTDFNGKQVEDLQIDTKYYDRLIATTQYDNQEMNFLFQRSEDEENWSYYLSSLSVNNDKQ